MPYRIKQSPNGKYLVINSETGRVLGTHDNKAKANRQLRAVYSATKGK